MKLTNLLKRPLRPIKRNALRVRDWWHYGAFAPYLALSQTIEGWTSGAEALALGQAARRLPAHAVIVEIGSFLGRSAVLLAGARKLAGSGRVHCVDPFDGSGDAFSVPVYQSIVSAIGSPQRLRFDENLRRSGLSEWVEVHAGTAEAISHTWRDLIDMIFLDGDQSPRGVRSAYDCWAPFLKPGGVIAVHNSSDRPYAPTHDGHRRLVVETIHAPDYVDVTCHGTTTLARKAAVRHPTPA